MDITRKSLISGIIRTMDLPVTEEQMHSYLVERKLVQDAFPHLTAAQREFIMTGITDEEWNTTFPPEEDEDFDDDEPAF